MTRRYTATTTTPPITATTMLSAFDAGHVGDVQDRAGQVVPDHSTDDAQGER
jgi:hypothetical protein